MRRRFPLPVDATATITNYTTVRLAYVFADGYEAMGTVSAELGYVPGDTLVIAPVNLATFDQTDDGTGIRFCGKHVRRG